MKIVVDKKKCQGHAMCMMVAPDIFVLDDTGYNVMDPFVVKDGKEDQARKGAQACPDGAILIEDDNE